MEYFIQYLKKKGKETHVRIINQYYAEYIWEYIAKIHKRTIL